jgi:hypothetical protein
MGHRCSLAHTVCLERRTSGAGWGLRRRRRRRWRRTRRRHRRPDASLDQSLGRGDRHGPTNVSHSASRKNPEARFPRPTFFCPPPPLRPAAPILCSSPSLTRSPCSTDTGWCVLALRTKRLERRRAPSLSLSTARCEIAVRVRPGEPRLSFPRLGDVGPAGIRALLSRHSRT